MLKHYVHWDQNEIITLRRLFYEEKTDAQIGEELQRPVSGVVKKRIDLGLMRAAAAIARAWTPEEIQVVKDGYAAKLSPWEISKKLPDRTSKQIQGYARIVLGLRRLIRKFTPEEDALLKQQYLAYKDFNEISGLMNRDVGTLRQRVVTLGYIRDRRRTCLIRRFTEIQPNDPRPVDEILSTLEKKQEEEKLVRDEAEQARIAKVLSQMVNAIATGADRRAEFQKAMTEGATLQEVGNMVGLTRERVRQIIHRVTAYITLERLARRLVKLTEDDYKYVMEAVTVGRKPQ